MSRPQLFSVSQREAVIIDPGDPEPGHLLLKEPVQGRLLPGKPGAPPHKDVTRFWLVQDRQRGQTDLVEPVRLPAPRGQPPYIGPGCSPALDCLQYRRPESYPCRNSRWNSDGRLELIRRRNDLAVRQREDGAVYVEKHVRGDQLALLSAAWWAVP